MIFNYLALDCYRPTHENLLPLPPSFCLWTGANNSVYIVKYTVNDNVSPEKKGIKYWYTLVIFHWASHEYGVIP